MNKTLLWFVVLSVPAAARMSTPFPSHPGTFGDGAVESPAFVSANPSMETEPMGAFYASPSHGVRIDLRQEQTDHYQLTGEERTALRRQLMTLPADHLGGLSSIAVKPLYLTQASGGISELSAENGKSTITFYVDDILNRRPPFYRTGRQPYPILKELTRQLAHHVYLHVLSAEQRRLWSAMDPGSPDREAAFVDRYVQWTMHSDDVFASFSGDADSLSEILLMAGLFADPDIHGLRWFSAPGVTSVKNARREAGLLEVGSYRFRLDGLSVVGIQISGGQEFTPALPIAIPQSILQAFSSSDIQ